jgi:hypothetical protein
VFEAHRMGVVNMDLRDDRNQFGREIRRVPDQQMMVPDRLARIDLFLGQKNLSDCSLGVPIEVFTILGKNQVPSNLFKQTE